MAISSSLILSSHCASRVISTCDLAAATCFSIQKWSKHFSSSRKKPKQLDYSRVPKLDEKDLEEQFIKGSGPGGSGVQKTINCVNLIHKPTGIVHKCHFSRVLHVNRKLAREQLIEKLDDFFNGDMSIKGQLAKLEKERSVRAQRKSRNLAEMKQKYLEHIKADTNSSPAATATNDLESESSVLESENFNNSKIKGK